MKLPEGVAPDPFPPVEDERPGERKNGTAPTTNAGKNGYFAINTQ